MELSLVDVLVQILVVHGVWYTLSWSDLPLWSTFRTAMCDRFPSVLEFLVCPWCFGFWVSVWVAFLSLGQPTTAVEVWTVVSLSFCGQVGNALLFHRLASD